MGFGSEYTLIGTQAEQKKYIGNAVEVNISRALCVALYSELNQFNKTLTVISKEWKGNQSSWRRYVKE